MPDSGEKAKIDGIEFKVTHADKRRIVQLKVTLPDVPTETTA